VAGEGLRIGTREFKQALADSPSLNARVLSYVRLLLLQTAQTAFANGRYTIEERLARWLLMSHDRLDGDEVPLTHEFLSLMLGVRRPGVTVALQTLEGEHAIRNVRGLITVLDRHRLEDIAGGAYQSFLPSHPEGLSSETTRVSG
jgi:CRP-like cAMP-binding protein